jgi:LmbE family N-acetylglucosaminyl deacetylase
MDDETLGCGGMLARAVDPLVVFGVESRDAGIEIDDVAASLGFRFVVLHGPEYEARMLSLDRRELVGRVEKILASESPDVVCIPSPSYHQDHVVMFESGLAATRPMSRFGYVAPAVLSYEYPGSAWAYDGREAELNYYVDISSVMEQKLAAIGRYNGSQAGRQIIDPGVVMSWARLRGAFAGLEYAEAFRALRLTVGDRR